MTPRNLGALAVAAALLCGSLGAAGLRSGAERSLVDAALRGGYALDVLAISARWIVRTGVGALGPSEAAARAGFAVLALVAASALAVAAHRALGRATGAWTLTAYVTLPLVLGTARHATPSALAQAAFTALFAHNVALHVGRDSAARVVASWLGRTALVALAWGAGRGETPADLAAALEASGHALFPWTGLAAVAVCALAGPEREGTEVERSVRAEALVTLLALLAWQVVGGGDGALLAAPLALALGLLLDRGSLDRAGAWLALLVTVVQARDLALYPRPLGVTTTAAMTDGPATLAAFAAGEFCPARYALAALAGCVPAFVLGVCGARRARAAVVVGAVSAALCFSRGAEPAWGRALSSSGAWQALRAQGVTGEPTALLAREGETPPALYASTSLPQWRDAESAARWLLAGGRRWLVVESASLGSLNRAHRAATGRNVTIAGGHAEGWSLATSVAGRSPLDEVVSGERVRVPDGARYEALRASRFGDALVLEGVDLRVRGALRPGATVEIGHHLRVLGPLAEERVFVHVDGPCARINADHGPAGGRYPTTLWLAGDRVRDGYTVTVPWYCPRGRYVVWVGFFHGDARMPVRDGPRDAADRVRAATLDLR